MMTGDWKEAKILLDEAVQLLPRRTTHRQFTRRLLRADWERRKGPRLPDQGLCEPKSFGHAHHSYYQFASILALLGRCEAAFEWLERSVSSGFACWPFFLKDPNLKNLRELQAFEVLVSSLQAKYPDHLGLL